MKSSEGVFQNCPDVLLGRLLQWIQSECASIWLELNDTNAEIDGVQYSSYYPLPIGDGLQARDPRTARSGDRPVRLGLRFWTLLGSDPVRFWLVDPCSKLLVAGLECHIHVVKWICLHMKLQMQTDWIGGIQNTRTDAKKRFIQIYQTVITMINSGHDLKQL